MTTLVIFDVAQQTRRRGVWRCLNQRGFVRLFENVATYTGRVDRREVKRAFTEALGRTDYRVVAIRLRPGCQTDWLSNKGGAYGG